VFCSVRSHNSLVMSCYLPLAGLEPARPAAGRVFAYGVTLRSNRPRRQIGEPFVLDPRSSLPTRR
jgi:hypothetical protein